MLHSFCDKANVLVSVMAMPIKKVTQPLHNYTHYYINPFPLLIY